MLVDPGEWVIAEGANGATIKDNVVPFNYKEPSNVLYQLLATLDQAAQRLASTTESLVGTADTQNTSPNTLMQLIQQGLKVYSAIQRRIFRGFKAELRKIVKLNAKYVNVQEYLELIDPPENELKEMFDQYGRLKDYNLEDMDIVPVVDSNEATQMEQMARSQMEIQTGLQITQANPQEKIIDWRVLANNAYTAFESPNLTQIVTPAPDPNAPNPQVIMAQHQMQMDQANIQIEQMKVKIQAMEQEAKARHLQAQAYKAVTDANTKRGDHHLDVAQHQFDKITSAADIGIQIQKLNQEMVQVPSTGDGPGKSQPAQSHPDVPSADETMDATHARMGTPTFGQTDNTMNSTPSGHKMVKPSHKLPDVNHLIPKHSPMAVHKEALRRGFKHV